MGIIPLDFALPMGSSYFKSWRLYLLLILTAPALFGVLLTLCTFESPKYLLSNISQEKALDVMKTIYSWNTGKEENSFPVGRLEKSRNIITRMSKLIVNTQDILRFFFLYFVPLSIKSCRVT